MAREVVDVAFVEVSIPTGPQSGNTELQELMSIDIDETDPGAEAVKTMRRRRRAIGFKRGVPEFELSLEVKPVNPPEINWLGLKQQGTLFQLFYEENDGGQRFTVEDCLVTEVSKTRNAEGEATDTITVLALDHRLDA
ncbi:hypothetical protein LCGC14_1295790 [marine sediment metagenome]|uniref:Phage tail protein n=1 Tax=marine sediment metagenome TaxID=412755 RepID=A0A0F9NTZ5_9ZZZZ